VNLNLLPWRRAPFLLLTERPQVGLVMAGAALMIGLASASAPLFLSSAENASLAQQLNNGCETGSVTVGSMDNYAGHGSGPDQFADDMFSINGTARAATVPQLSHLSAPTRMLFAPHVMVSAARTGSGSAAWITLASKPGDTTHVDVLSRAQGVNGIWLADTTANALHVVAGGTIALQASSGSTPMRLQVAGTFRDLESEPAQPFWCDAEQYIVPPPSANPPPVFPFGFLTQDEMRSAGQLLPLNLTDADVWTIRPGGLTLPLARSMAKTLDNVVVAVPGELTAQRATLENKYVTAHPTFQPDDLIDIQAAERAETEVDLPVDRVSAVGRALPSTITPIAIAGVLVSLGLVFVAGGFWVDRRRREVDVLIARGSTPFAIGVKAAIEVCIPFIVGGLAGVGLADVLVRAVGPSSLLAGRSLVDVGLDALLGLVAGLIFLVAAATRGCQRREAPPVPRSSSKRRVWTLIASVVLVAIAAIVIASRLKHRTHLSGSGPQVAHVDPVVIVVPMLAFILGAATVQQILVRLIRRFALKGGELSVPNWLAWRRIGGNAKASATLVAVLVPALAISVFSAFVNSSVQRTLHDSSRMIAGADDVVNLQGPVSVPASLSKTATLVLRIDHPTFGNELVSVVGVDPTTFRSGAFWDGGIAGQSFPALIRRLHDQGPGKPLLGVLSGGGIASGSRLTAVADGNKVTDNVTIVGGDTRLPGQQGGYEILYVDLAALERIDPIGTYQFWISGSPSTAADALAAAHITTTWNFSADSVVDGSYLQPVSYTFAYLSAVIAVIGAVALGGVLLYLDARSRPRRLSYVLARRMGLSRRAHFLSIFIELSTLVAAGAVVALGFCGIAVGLLRSRFTVQASLPPSAVLSWPFALAAADLAALAVLVAVSATAVQLGSDRVRAVEVLREAN
jgi:putative ABC transport system permease protein